MGRWILIGLLIALALVTLIALVVTRIENAQYTKNRSHLSSTPTGRAAKVNTVIVVFSRSGNTGVLADHIALQTAGHVYEISAESYQLGISGWINALKDARSNVADITPSHIDLEPYDTVFLGSPIWLYSPAPPIWQFVKDNDFTGKNVVLFNTFNSKFKQQYIDDFAKLVFAKGAKSFKHRYVKRGRMGDQISQQQMLKEFDAQSTEVKQVGHVYVNH
ncbi:flavodoxin [Shewanella loihica]|uniref:Flavodoxin-like domain-containing protein n=1 Tax=Shewanella loihica (strain ATCC BAA-1088 / PV-4) TaxID=323850 RepID=A3QEE8_SHELP|nr:flavodoxin [Shewanella loihica]ABO23846.1 conserved hypothetical protein [Shewanella loihica PV-4]